MQRATAGLVHLWHPVRGKSKSSKAENLRRAQLRYQRSWEEWEERAYREVAMTGLPTCERLTKEQWHGGWHREGNMKVLSPPGSTLRSDFGATFTEDYLRKQVANEARREGWPALAWLANGAVFPSCVYTPVLGAKVTDVGRTNP